MLMLCCADLRAVICTPPTYQGFHELGRVIKTIFLCEISQ